MIQFELLPSSLCLTRIDPEQNMRWFYRLDPGSASMFGCPLRCKDFFDGLSV